MFKTGPPKKRARTDGASRRDDRTLAGSYRVAEPGRTRAVGLSRVRGLSEAGRVLIGFRLNWSVSWGRWIRTDRGRLGLRWIV